MTARTLHGALRLQTLTRPSLAHILHTRQSHLGLGHSLQSGISQSWKRCFSTVRSIDSRADSLLCFWLGDEYSKAPKNDTITAKREMWFKSSPETDKECKDRFSSLLQEAASDDFPWTSGYEGLAAVILMDQLSRNIFRGTAQMYALDGKSIQLAKSLHDGGTTSSFPAMHRVWLYMTHMHSESREDQELGIQRFKELMEEAKQVPDSEDLQKSLQGNISFGEKHLKVIEDWGRFPHRNNILGRQSTPEEVKGFEAGSIPSF